MKGLEPVSYTACGGEFLTVIREGRREQNAMETEQESFQKKGLRGHLRPMLQRCQGLRTWVKLLGLAICRSFLR